MKMNVQKTKLLTSGFLLAEKQPTVLDQKILEEVDHFKYLGSVIIMMNQDDEVVASAMLHSFSFIYTLSYGLNKKSNRPLKCTNCTSEEE